MNKLSRRHFISAGAVALASAPLLRHAGFAAATERGWDNESPPIPPSSFRAGPLRITELEDGIEDAAEAALESAFPAPNDPLFPQQWGLNNTGQAIIDIRGKRGVDIGWLAAQDILAQFVAGGKELAEVVVAVLGTGFDFQHPDLQGVSIVGPGQIPNFAVPGEMMTGDSGNALSESGTIYGGVIAALSNNREGIAGMAHCKILPLQVADPGRNILLPTNDAVMAAIDFLLTFEPRPRVLWFPYWSESGFARLQNRINRLEAAGINTAVAARATGGGSGSDQDQTPAWPSAYNTPGMITATMVKNQGELMREAWWGKNTVHVGAPGWHIPFPLPGGKYDAVSGTNLAAAHVAGSLALLYSMRPELTAAEAKQMLLANVAPLSSLKNKTVTGGMVKADKLLTAALQ